MILPLSLLWMLVILADYDVKSEPTDDEPIYGNLTLQEYYDTRGQGYEGRQRNLELACIIKRRFLPAGETLSPCTDELFDDIIYTYEQLLQIEEATRNIQNNIKKRKILDFNVVANKWPLQIEYTYQANLFTTAEKLQIDEAMQLWTRETCIKFSKRTSSSGNAAYISFERTKSGCSSYIGRAVNFGRQYINLAAGCFSGTGRFTHRIGTIVHEVGHALGLIHEQSRRDRDKFVNIHKQNINASFLGDFAIKLNQDQQILDTVPYDLSSVMQYPPWAFRLTSSVYTVTPKDDLYRLSLGQNYRPSFFDAKAVNLAYCSGECATPLQNTCERAGYQDPKNCAVCRCMEGWTSSHCIATDPGSFGRNSGCPKAGTLMLQGGQDECIDVRMPHFDTTIRECNWHVKLAFRPRTDTIDFWLTSIDLFCRSTTCYDYVEVKFNNGLKTRGPRFCCRQPEDGVDGGKGHFITSETNEIIVNFASFVSSYTPKFKMCFSMTARCSMRGIGGRGIITATHLSSSLPKPAIDVKVVLAQQGADNDPCRIKVVARTDSQGALVWAAVSLGMHPNQKKFAKKYNKNYAFNLQGKKGVWERGAKLKNPIQIPRSAYPIHWTDGNIVAKIVQVAPLQEWRLEVKCGTKKLLEFEFGKSASRNVEMSFGREPGWNGECF